MLLRDLWKEQSLETCCDDCSLHNIVQVDHWFTLPQITSKFNISAIMSLYIDSYKCAYYAMWFWKTTAFLSPIEVFLTSSPPRDVLISKGGSLFWWFLGMAQNGAPITPFAFVKLFWFSYWIVLSKSWIIFIKLNYLDPLQFSFSLLPSQWRNDWPAQD